MKGGLNIELAGTSVCLLPGGGLYWEEQRSLFIADFHLGKANHFRKNGIPIPLAVQERNLAKLSATILDTNCQRVYFLGDLFHSDNNRSWEALIKKTSEHSDIEFHLIIGNHDILSDAYYQAARLHIHQEGLLVPPFELAHHPHDHIGIGYRLCGHIHPAVKLKGKGRQGFRLSCFWATKYQMILPAFGGFTGRHTIHPVKDDKVYVVTEKFVKPI